MEGVDPDRLGVFGVSMGGTIVWPMAAMDGRVKAACAIYGVGWNTHPDEIGAPDPQAGDAGVATWRAAMEPESRHFTVAATAWCLISCGNGNAELGLSPPSREGSNSPVQPELISCLGVVA